MAKTDCEDEGIAIRIVVAISPVLLERDAKIPVRGHSLQSGRCDVVVGTGDECLAVVEAHDL